MRVLVGMEFSGIIRDAFVENGHYAISCDLLETERPGNHYQGDIYDMLEGAWDLIIMHPVCTCLTVAGNKHYGSGMPKHRLRIKAAEYTENLWRRCIEISTKVCFEQPVSVLSTMTCIPRASYTHPWLHGHTEQKKTGLHLHNLDPIKPTNNVYAEMMKLPKNERERVFYMAPGPDRWRDRSRTFPGIARAMADQWGATSVSELELLEAQGQERLQWD